MMKTSLLFYLLVGVSAVCSYYIDDYQFNLEWTNFKQTHNRQYGIHEEETMRKNIFERNMKTIQMHNVNYSRGLTSYKMSLNQFSDMTSEERASMKKLRISNDDIHAGYKFVSTIKSSQLPKEIDWRTKGIVTKVGLQENCASCYAWATIGAIESQNAKKTGHLVSLSVQNVIDCTTRYGNMGCMGGRMTSVYRYVIDNKGVDTENSYPYVDTNQTCTFNRNSVGATIKGFVTIEQGNEQKLMEAVATVGPVAAAMDISHFSFDRYGGGIYEEPECDRTMLGHAVLIVGYGSENGKDFWIVKNSYGPHWGEGGYFRILRNKNHCGIAEFGNYPVV